jgi:hypothetical protein
MNRYLACGIVLSSMFVAVGCGRKESPITAASSVATQEDLKTVRLHFDGFTKSKSGAT